MPKNVSTKKRLAIFVVLISVVLVACGGQGSTPPPEPISLTTENISDFLEFNVSVENYVETTQRIVGRNYTHARADVVVESRRLRNATLEDTTVAIEVITQGQWTDAIIEINISFDGVGTGRSQITHGGPFGTDSFIITAPRQPSATGFQLEIIGVSGYAIEN